MATKLHSIGALPPLSKSRQKDLACESLYVAKHIEHVPEVEGEAARRGTQIHAAIRFYVNHLMMTKQSSDYDYLRTAAQMLMPEAKEIIERFVENFIFDPEGVLFVEQRIALAENFAPVDVGSPEAAYEGTPDLVTLPSATDCRIDDWKSQFSIHDADTFEAGFYSLLLFSINPGFQKVTFAFDFVRYGAASREVSFTRDDVPMLQEIARRERARQIKLHDLAVAVAGGEPKASPGAHCTYCPLLTDGCPLAKVNPYLKLTPEQRLSQAVWLKKAYENNIAILRTIVVEQGPLECRDDIGGLLRAEFREKVTHHYPLTKTVLALASWKDSHPGDGNMIDNLNVSGLSSPLKAKKRDALREQLLAVCETRSQTDFRVGTIMDAEDDS